MFTAKMFSANVYDRQRAEFAVTLDNGAELRAVATIFHDDDSEAPWERCDGHGPVSDWTTRDKRPGELVLSRDGHSKRFYDYAEACRIARAEGWGHGPDIEGESARQKAARAALADYENLRAWCNDQWSYVGVAVRIWLDDMPLTGEYDAALWGIESNSGEDYIAQVAGERLHGAIFLAKAKLRKLAALANEQTLEALDSLAAEEKVTA
jgi:hypothetical protein